METFAGEAQVTRMFRYANLASARLDLTYMDGVEGKQNPMDLLTDSGFASLCGI